MFGKKRAINYDPVTGEKIGFSYVEKEKVESIKKSDLGAVIQRIDSEKIEGGGSKVSVGIEQTAEGVEWQKASYNDCVNLMYSTDSPPVFFERFDLALMRLDKMVEAQKWIDGKEADILTQRRFDLLDKEDRLRAECLRRFMDKLIADLLKSRNPSTHMKKQKRYVALLLPCGHRLRYDQQNALLDILFTPYATMAEDFEQLKNHQEKISELSL